MADTRSVQPQRSMLQGTYTLQPVRSRTLHACKWIGICLLCAASGALAMHCYMQYQIASMPTPNTAPLRAELLRMQFALTQNRAALAVEQKSADSASAEAARLKTELQFLRAQSLSCSRRP
jgi:hypothetical protein